MLSQKDPFTLRYLRANASCKMVLFDFPFLVRYRTMNGKTSRSFYEGVMLVPSRNFQHSISLLFRKQKIGGTSKNPGPRPVAGRSLQVAGCRLSVVSRPLSVVHYHGQTKFAFVRATITRSPWLAARCPFCLLYSVYCLLPSSFAAYSLPLTAYLISALDFA
jgi:hypothetical protein